MSIAPEPVPPHLPRVPQFTLRTLLIVIALCGMLFALMQLMGLAWSILVAWLLLMAGAHVAANVWGSTFGSTRQRRGSPLPNEAASKDRQTRPPLRFAPITPLRGKAHLGRRLLLVTASGAILGGSIVTYLLCLICWRSAGVAGVLVGGLSAAVIGGFLGFLASSFVAVASRAWGEATKDSPSANSDS